MKDQLEKFIQMHVESLKIQQEISKTSIIKKTEKELVEKQKVFYRSRYYLLIDLCKEFDIEPPYIEELEITFGLKSVHPDYKK